MSEHSSNSSGISSRTRRDFLKSSSVAAGAAAFAAASSQAFGVHTGTDETLRIGLVGCGGRGTGAAKMR